MKLRSGLMAAILIVLGVASASAQTRVVTGKVTDSLTSEADHVRAVTVVGTTIGTRSRMTARYHRGAHPGRVPDGPEHRVQAARCFRAHE